MTKLQALIRDMSQQCAEESIGDVEEDGVNITLVKGNLLNTADELGYDVTSTLQRKLKDLCGAIVYVTNDSCSVETFTDEFNLDEQWDVIAARVDAEIESQLEE